MTRFEAQNIGLLSQRISKSMDENVSKELSRQLVQFFSLHQHNLAINDAEVPSLKNLAHREEIIEIITALSSGTMSWFLFSKMRPHLVHSHPEFYTILLLIWLTQPGFSLLWDQLNESKTINDELLKVLGLIEDPNGLHTLVNYWNYKKNREGSTSDDIDGFLSTHKFI